MRTQRLFGKSTLAVSVVAFAACVPPGNSTPSDAGAQTTSASAQPEKRVSPAANALTGPFEDTFDRTPVPVRLPLVVDAAAPVEAGVDGAVKLATGDAGGTKRAADAGMAATEDAGMVLELGPNWRQASTNAWRIENGRLCAQNARNHGVWLTRALPPNARIEFDAMSESPQGDLKAEVWGDGQSAATAISYTNATSYLTIFGGWKNQLHVLARIDEHGKDRKEIKVDKTSDDPREKAVVPGQTYHFKIERSDGKTVRWFVDGLEMLSWNDSEPLSGPGHEYFGFNDWDAKVCFDNVKVVPLPSM